MNPDSGPKRGDQTRNIQNAFIALPLKSRFCPIKFYGSKEITRSTTPYLGSSYWKTHFVFSFPVLLHRVSVYIQISLLLYSIP